MRTSGAAPAMAVLGFGALLINTMPAWIAEMAARGGVADSSAGALASLLLLCAAAACACAPRVRRSVVTWPALAALPLSLGALAMTGSAAGLPALCAILGASLGYLSALALTAATGTGALRLIVSRSLGIGLVVALAVYLSNAAFGASVLWMLGALALALLPVMVPLSRCAAPQPRPTLGRWSGLPVWQLPFFTMMGAYWAYLELYGSRLADAGALSLWLSASLVTGALGSFIAGGIGGRLSAKLAAAALVCAALTGALSYVAPSEPVLGLSILANGFFLFLYFPLYLAGSGGDADGSSVALRMASYLLGFAAGGLIGALVLEAAGFAGLAAGIALSGFIGLKRPAGLHRS